MDSSSSVEYSQSNTNGAQPANVEELTTSVFGAEFRTIFGGIHRECIRMSDSGKAPCMTLCRCGHGCGIPSPKLSEAFRSPCARYMTRISVFAAFSVSALERILNCDTDQARRYVSWLLQGDDYLENLTAAVQNLSSQDADCQIVEPSAPTSSGIPTDSVVRSSSCCKLNMSLADMIVSSECPGKTQSTELSQAVDQRTPVQDVEIADANNLAPQSVDKPASEKLSLASAWEEERHSRKQLQEGIANLIPTITVDASPTPTETLAQLESRIRYLERSSPNAKLESQLRSVEQDVGSLRSLLGIGFTKRKSAEILSAVRKAFRRLQREEQAKGRQVLLLKAQLALQGVSGTTDSPFPSLDHMSALKIGTAIAVAGDHIERIAAQGDLLAVRDRANDLHELGLLIIQRELQNQSS